MATISREPINIIVEVDVGGTNTETSLNVIPNKETWQINRIVFADVARPNNNWSGLFKVDFGVDGSREIIMVAYLLGTTLPIEIKRNYIGDGLKAIRIITENLGNTSKSMFVMIEGFKRI